MGSDGERLLFINDVFFCMQDGLRLLLHEKVCLRLVPPPQMTQAVREAS